MKYLLQSMILLMTVNFLSCDFYNIEKQRIISIFKENEFKSEILKSGNRDIHYWIGGSGPKLIFIHGFGADSKFQWYKQIETFSKKYQCIIPDLIYFGKSTSNDKKYSVDYQADSIIRLINHLKINKTAIVGISYGGLVGVTVADKLPKKVEKLVICDSPVKYYTVQDNERALKMFKAESIFDLLLPDEPAEIPRLLKMAYYDPPYTPGFVLKDIHDNMFKHQREEKLKLLRHLLNNEKYFGNKNYIIQCPILLVWGKYDYLIPVRVGKQLHQYFGDRSEMLIIDEAAHMPSLEQPETFNKVVMKFLSQ